MFAPHAAFADYIMSQRGKPDRIPAQFRIGGQAMEGVIAKLLQDFEQGKMNRRQLIQSLSLAAAAAAGMAPAARTAGKPLEALYVDHIAYTVTNWDAEKDGFEEELKRRGLQYRGSAKTSFHVKDPEGMGVQFGGLHQ